MDGREPWVVVVGSVNVDVVVRVPHLPGAGETVTRGTYRFAAGGKGGNQAVAAARLGAHTRLIACVGDDDHGRAAVAELQAEGVLTDDIQVDAAAPTGLAAVLVDEAGENSIAVASGANHALDPDRVAGAILAIAAPTDVVVLACLEVSDEVVLAAAAAASRRGWPFVLNPAPARHLPADLLGFVTVLTPNENELGRLGFAGSAQLLSGGATAVVTTLGAVGAEVCTASSSPTLVPAPSVGAVDTTGAGDTFSGALAVSLAEGASLMHAARFACAAAGLSTTGPGARSAMPTRAEAMAVLMRS